MTEGDYYYNKSSRDAAQMDRQHEASMETLIERQEYNLFSMIRPTLTKDGDKWCCLYGENIMEGIAGFGETPYLSILDFNKAFNKS